MTKADEPNDRGFLIEIEQQLLGAILRGGDHAAALGIIKPHNFVEQVHGEIFALIISARATYGTTQLSVVDKMVPKDLEAAFKVNADGLSVAGYMRVCVDTAVYGAAGSYRGAKAVLEQWGRVILGQQAAIVAAAARDPDALAKDLVRQAGSVFDDILTDLRSSGRGRTLWTASEASLNALSRAMDAKKNGRLLGIPTGLGDIDRATTGLHKKDLIVIAARPSIGKTVVGGALARNAAKRGFGAGFISLEMDNEKLSTRLLSDIAYDLGHRIPYRNIMAGEFSDEEARVLEEAQQKFDEMPLLIEDQSGLTVTDIRVKIEKMLEDAHRAGWQLQELVIDHLHLIKASDRYKGARTGEITEITGSLKQIARDYDLALVLLSQLSRAVEQRDDKRPMLSDLRDSGSIEQDADLVAFLFRQEYYLERSRPDPGDIDAQATWQKQMSEARNTMEFAIAKQRNGPVKTINLWTDVALSAVRSAALGYGANG